MNNDFANFDAIMHGDKPACFKMTVIRRSNVLHATNQKVLTFGHIHASHGIHIMSPIKCFCPTNSPIGNLNVGTIFTIESYLHHGLDHDLWLKQPTKLQILKRARNYHLISRMHAYIHKHQLKAKYSKHN